MPAEITGRGSRTLGPVLPRPYGHSLTCCICFPRNLLSGYGLTTFVASLGLRVNRVLGRVRVLARAAEPAEYEL